jgi:hypothetical protein
MGSKATAAAIIDALNMAGKARAGSSVERGDDEEAPSEEQDEKVTPEYWAEILAMLAIRWMNEIIVEKSCILFGAVATMLVDAVKSPHTLPVQLLLLLIFYSTEILADVLLVFVLDGRYSVPFLRLPQPALWSKKFWIESTETIWPILAIIFTVIYAHHSTTKWLDADDADLS